MTKLEYALYWAQQGFRVFPLWPNTKEPAIDSWQREATQDPDRIKYWWRDPRPEYTGYQDWNIAVTGKLVLDVDMKNGYNGIADLADLTCLNDWPDTLVFQTPTGGQHIIFDSDKDVGNSRGDLPKSIDIRGPVTGYIVAPGSTIDDKPYTVLQDKPVSMAPDWLYPRLRKSVKSKDAGEVKEGIELDAEHNIDRALRYLENEAPLSIEGQKGDDTLYAVACTVLDFGLSGMRAYDLIMDRYNWRCHPQWTAEEVYDKVNNAIAYRQDAIGKRAPSAELLAMAKTVEQPMSIQRTYRTREELASYATPNWLIKNFMAEKSITMIYGQPGSGKSFLTLELARCLLKGALFAGEPTKACSPFLYITGEGTGGVRKRIMALEKYHDTYLDGFMFMDKMLPFFNADGSDAQAMIRDIKELDPAVIAIDTLSAAMVGGNENETKDAVQFMAFVYALRDEIDCAIILVHHTDKEGKGARGSGVLIDKTDAAVSAYKNEEGIHAMLVRHKDAECFENAMTFEAIKIEVEDDTSLALMYDEGKAERKAERRENKKNIEKGKKGVNQIAHDIAVEVLKSDGGEYPVDQLATKVMQEWLIRQDKIGVNPPQLGALKDRTGLIGRLMSCKGHVLYEYACEPKYADGRVRSFRWF